MSCNERRSVTIGCMMFVGSVALFAVLVTASSSELLAKTKRFQPANETMIYVEVIVKQGPLAKNSFCSRWLGFAIRPLAVAVVRRVDP